MELVIYFYFLKEAHVNTCYKHFVYFVTEFNLLRKEEMEPLVSILEALEILFFF